MTHPSTPRADTPEARFMSEFTGFAQDITQKFHEQDMTLMKLNQKLAQSSRPPLGTHADGTDLHLKALGAYLRNGDDDGLRHLPPESKAMNTQVASDGGYLVDPQTAATIGNVLATSGSLRAVASVVAVEASSFDVLVDHGAMATGWASEVDATAESDTGSLDRISIPLHELSAMPKISQRLLDDSAFDVETWLAERIAGSFATSESGAFINGNGVNKPRGLMNYPQVANEAWVWGNIGTVTTGDADGIGDGDGLIDLIYGLGAQYRAAAHFVMNSRTAGTIRKLRDADGRFLWSDAITGGEPARLLGYPVVIAEDMPDIAAGAAPVAFGNFASAYTIAERPDLRILRDPFSAKPHVLFYATKRVGGGVTDFAAVKLLTCAAA